MEIGYTALVAQNGLIEVECTTSHNRLESPRKMYSYRVKHKLRELFEIRACA